MRQPLTQAGKLGEIIEVLKRDGVGVLPTDTLYGIVGSALSRRTVARIYRLRRRNPKKPMIILIGSIGDLAPFGVRPSPKIKKLLNRWWPGKVSVALPISRSAGARENFLTKFSYLHRGTGTLAFRLPASAWLRKLLHETGPLVAPSANFEGEPPAKTIRAARKYFGDGVDFYLDVGKLDHAPSTLVAIENNKVLVLRKGAARIA